MLRAHLPADPHTLTPAERHNLGRRAGGKRRRGLHDQADALLAVVKISQTEDLIRGLAADPHVPAAERRRLARLLTAPGGEAA